MMADQDIPAITGAAPAPYPTPALNRWQGDLQGEEAAVTHKQADFDARQKTAADIKDKALTPLEKDMEAETSQPLPKRPEHVEMPKYDDKKPIVSGQEAEGLGMALIAMAVIGGAKSHGNWLGVSSALNGTLTGFIDGHEELAQKAYKDYQTKFAAAKEQEAQANKEFENILEDRKLTINEKIQQYKIAAAKYDRQDMRFAAEQKSIDKMWEQLNAHRSALNAADSKHENITVQIDARAAAKEAKGGSTVPLSDDAKQNLYERMAAGDKGVIAEASGYDRSTRRELENGFAEYTKAHNLNGADIVAAKAALSSETKAEGQAENRAVAVDRIEKSFSSLGPELDRLAKAGAAKGIPMTNATINDLRSKLGDEDLSKLKILTTELPTQFIEAMTMPGSNAQMHEGARAAGEVLTNPNMTYHQLMGQYQEMQKILQSNGAAIHSIVTAEDARIRAGNQPGSTTGGSKTVHWDDLK
jgi:hypothetical protein